MTIMGYDGSKVGGDRGRVQRPFTFSQTHTTNLWFFGVSVWGALRFGGRGGAVGPAGRLAAYFNKVYTRTKSFLSVSNFGYRNHRTARFRFVSRVGNGRRRVSRRTGRPHFGIDAGASSFAGVDRLFFVAAAIGVSLALFPLVGHAAEIPKDAQRLIEDSGVSVQQLSEWNLRDLLQWLTPYWENSVQGPLSFLAQLCPLLLLAGCVGLTAGKRGWKECLDTVAVLSFGVMSLSVMTKLLGTLTETASQSQAYLAIFAPVYSGIAILGGQTAGASVYNGMFYAMAAVLSVAMERLLLPIIQIYFCVAASASVWGSQSLQEAARFFARTLSGMLKIVGYLFANCKCKLDTRTVEI